MAHPDDPHSSDSRPPADQPVWVLDTNVLLDWLVFHDPTALVLGGWIEARRARLISRCDVRAELEHVLAYPSLPLDQLGRDQALTRFDHWAQPLDGVESLSTRPDRTGGQDQSVQSHGHGHGPSLPAPSTLDLPVCRDPTDQKFLEVAGAAGATWLITKDKRLLELTRRLVKVCGCEVLTPTRARARLDIIGADDK